MISAVEMILTERLCAVYSPEWIYDYYAKRDPWKCKPVGFLDDSARVKVHNYDERRVRYFMDKLMQGEMFEPIDVDCRWFGGVPGPPEVLDGHHRYAAAIFLGIERIPISFGGVVRVCDWLSGRIGIAPPEAGL